MFMPESEIERITAQASTSEIEALAERFGFPAPIGDPEPRPLVAAQIDLTETYERTGCCCALHGSLHNPLDCCPAHKRARAGLPVPKMTPIA